MGHPAGRPHGLPLQLRLPAHRGGAEPAQAVRDVDGGLLAGGDRGVLPDQLRGPHGLGAVARAGPGLTDWPVSEGPPASDRETTHGLGVLLELLDLEPIDRDLFRVRNPGEGGRVFGGQVASQALRGAANTVEVDHHVNSLHAYFLRPGRPGRSILYSVDRIRDGTSFTTRRVVAAQEGEAILNLEASFHKDEPGPEHQLLPIADLADPDALPRRPDRGRRRHGRPIDSREVDGPSPSI